MKLIDLKEYVEDVDGQEYDGIFKATDEETGKPVYIAWTFDSQYNVDGLSWKPRGPFKEADPITSNWGEWAQEQLELHDPKNNEAQ